jgi:hypothetical protein
MRKRLAPPVVSSTPTKRKFGAAAGVVRKSGVVVVPVEHTAKRRGARLRISAVKASKQREGWG